MNTDWKSPDLNSLDLSLLLNLKILKAKDCWLITKKPGSNIKIPSRKCAVYAVFYCVPSEWPIFWDVLIRLVGIKHYDFEISTLNCELGRSGPLEYLSNFDSGGLKYLRLSFENNYL